MKRTTFTLSLSPDVFDRLTAAAVRMDVSRGAIARMALQDWFRRHDTDLKATPVQTGASTERSAPQDSWAGLRMNLAMPSAAVKPRKKRNRLDLPSVPPPEEAK